MRLVGLLSLLTLLSACGSRDPVEWQQVMQAAAMQGVAAHVDEMTAAEVRTTAHAAIDRSAQYAKWKIDLAVTAWESLPVEQRRALVRTLLASVKTITAAVDSPVMPSGAGPPGS